MSTYYKLAGNTQNLFTTPRSSFFKPFTDEEGRGYTHIDEYGSEHKLPFSPYEEAAYQTASVLTAPFIYAHAAIYNLLRAGAYFLSAVAHLVNLNFDSALDDISTCGSSLFTAVLCIIATPFSPIINLIDLIGSGINTLMQSLEESSESPNHYPSM
jgi:hypothetical protein